jgi:hypothetical protein
MAPSFLNHTRGVCSRRFGGMPMLIREAHPKRIRRHLTWLLPTSLFLTVPWLAVLLISLSHH